MRDEPPGNVALHVAVELANVPAGAFRACEEFVAIAGIRIWVRKFRIGLPTRQAIAGEGFKALETGGLTIKLMIGFGFDKLPGNWLL